MTTPTPGNEPGLETRLLRAWPWALAGGTVLPLLVAWMLAWGYPDIPSGEEHKRLLQSWFALAGAVVFYWTMAFTVAAGCWIVRVMKGPVRERDGYPLPKPDRFEV
jgi:protein-S-isoprenylcysteine O-methyltransferase Ste14